MMLAMVWMMMAAVMYLLRPSSMRGQGDAKPQGQSTVCISRAVDLHTIFLKLKKTKKIMLFFNFSLLDPDPHIECGKGMRIHADPDPQRWFYYEILETASFL